MDIDAILSRFGKEIVFLLVGLLLIGSGLIFLNRGTGGAEVQVIDENSQVNSDNKIIVEVSGAVQNPGVYKFFSDARVDDALNQAGGITEDADADWVEKTINKAGVLSDGQKIYIPKMGEEGQVAGSNTEGKLVNINTAGQSELESLWGIGPVYAQNIIEHRPYSSAEELVSKGVIKQNVYDRNKDKLTVY